MSTREFFDDDARARVKKVIAELETTGGAELVVAVRPSSGSYRAADFACGALVAFACVILFLFHPRSFATGFLPVELILAFVVGSLASAGLPQLRRALSGGKELRANAERAARAAFVDLGIANTRARSGVLVFVSMFERRAVLLLDVGLDKSAIELQLRKIDDALEDAARRADFLAFEQALRKLGPCLALICPRRDDDENELPDEVHVA